MKLGIISDTHDDVENVKKVIEIFKEKKIDIIIHLGDYVSPPIVKLFKGFNLTGIFGNNDGFQFGLINTFNEIDGRIIGGHFAKLIIDGLKIALYHGEFREVSEALAKSGDFDVIFTGHFHLMEEKKFEKTQLISPGSPHKFLTNDENPSAAIFDTESREVKFIKI
ncbi:MAG: metallophosphoesterase [Actinobacteria bacterium]|nr:metallophosphoesterase [Actinomycetota bacterium]